MNDGQTQLHTEQHYTTSLHSLFLQLSTVVNKIYILLYFHTIFSDVQNNASIASLRLAVAAAQHGAVNVEEAVAGGVAAEEARLVAVVDGEAVAVAEAEVAVLVPDRAVAVPAALVVHRHPVGPILPVSDDSLQNQEVRNKFTQHVWVNPHLSF